MTLEREDRAGLESLSKVAVRALADSLREADPDDVERCVAFVCAETVNLWHGRGRAMMCRRLKHVVLTQEQQSRLLEAVLGRLSSGKFSEQFRDQLRLALHLDAERSLMLARHELTNAKPHVRRFASWIIARGIIQP